MSCSITFSHYLARQSLPEHNIVAGNWYWVSDQELPGEDGNMVRLVGHIFLQREDEPEDGDRPARVAGNAYLRYQDCATTGDGLVTCELGACNLDDCCYLTFEHLCNGDFQGPNTECVLPECFQPGACCGVSGIDCFNVEQHWCLLWDGYWVAHTTCEETPYPCDGACCLYDGEVGIGCIPDQRPSECLALADSESITHTFWQGPGIECHGKDGADCPETGACCANEQSGFLGCTITTVEDCCPDPDDEDCNLTFMGLGTHCTDEGVCGGACCHHVQTGHPGDGSGECFDAPRPYLECIGPTNQFLGPGTTCQLNAGDCGVCCLYDPAKDEIYCEEGLLQADCLAQGGTPFGPGSDCTVCDTVGRACCIFVWHLGPHTHPGPGDEVGDNQDDPHYLCNHGKHRCRNVRTEQECLELQGVFHRDGDCFQIGDCVSVAGACCCPSGHCPSPPCNNNDPGKCTCFQTEEHDCPSSCVWRGPGRGCGHLDDPDNIPDPVPALCLVDCDHSGCVPGGD